MARRNNSAGISPGGKVALLCVILGIPLLFALSSWGLDKLFQAAPWVAVVVLVLVATAYTARTAGLLHRYYEVDPPLLRFVPCLCEVTLIDQKFRGICYILYAIAAVMACGVAMPYSIASKFGNTFVIRHTVWFGLACGLFLAAVQVVKGIGIMGCMNDVADDWYQQTHTDVGLIKRFTPLGFIPFVRVIALYSLNKPLDTMVDFMGVNVSDAGGEEQFFEEE